MPGVEDFSEEGVMQFASSNTTVRGAYAYVDVEMSEDDELSNIDIFLLIEEMDKKGYALVTYMPNIKTMIFRELRRAYE